MDFAEAGSAFGQERAVIEAHEIGAQIGDGTALDAMARLPIRFTIVVAYSAVAILLTPIAPVFIVHTGRSMLCRPDTQQRTSVSERAETVLMSWFFKAQERWKGTWNIKTQSQNEMKSQVR